MFVFKAFKAFISMQLRALIEELTGSRWPCNKSMVEYWSKFSIFYCSYSDFTSFRSNLRHHSKEVCSSKSITCFRCFSLFHFDGTSISWSWHLRCLDILNGSICTTHPLYLGVASYILWWRFCTMVKPWFACGSKISLLWRVRHLNSPLVSHIFAVDTANCSHLLA